jgi:glycosyltransferase involved in cell wall biosynthesis
MKSVMVVVECGKVIYPSGVTVRAYQFSGLFHQSPHFTARYFSRRSPQVELLIARLRSRGWSVAAGSVLARLDPLLTRVREQLIVRAAVRFDVVYLLRIHSWRLHKALWDAGHAKIVMDVNDAQWVPWHRQMAPHFEESLRHSHALACENEHILSYVSRFNPSAFVVPDAPQVEEFDKMRLSVKPSSDKVTLGWIGSPRAADNLYSIFEPLEALFKRHRHLHLRVLGADPERLPRFENVRFSWKVRYTNDEMVQEALQMDIGLFPLFRTDDSLGRGSLKARIYMSAGMVAVCEKWGDATALIEHGINGVLAASAEEWLQTLDWLVTHPAARQSIAERGLATIRERFTREACFARLTSVFDRV